MKIAQGYSQMYSKQKNETGILKIVNRFLKNKSF